MTAHEVARALLELPDVTVMIYHDCELGSFFVTGLDFDKAKLVIWIEAETKAK